MKLNYNLADNQYTWKKAFNFGYSREHAKLAIHGTGICAGRRVVHGLIAIIDLIPFAAACEKLAVKNLLKGGEKKSNRFQTPPKISTVNATTDPIKKVDHSVEKAPLEDLDTKINKKISLLLEGLKSDKQRLIGGFLNLGESHGWPDGGYSNKGYAFVRLLTLKFALKRNDFGFSDINVLENILQSYKITKRDTVCIPTNSRVIYDTTTRGWHAHAVSRMVGNLASKYDPKLPFFEILINSARTSKFNSITKPFTISVFANGDDLEKRRQLLKSQRPVDAKDARKVFYHGLTSPGKYLELYEAKLGPNSKRILQGLIYLQNVKLNAQSVGNCWIKQPIRGLLVTLYLELFSGNQDLTPEQAWKEALKFYKLIQHEIGIPLIQEMLDTTEGITPQMRESALAALEKRKTRS